MTRNECRLIAEELYRLIHNDVKKAIGKAVAEGMEEHLDAKQAAEYLGWAVQTLYNRIEEIPHAKHGRKLVFTKSSLKEYMERA